jgi:hypothetical protein
MAFNLFGKVYVSPDWAYDNGYNRCIFSEWRNQAAYTSYDVLDSPGFEAEVLLSTASITDVIGDGTSANTEPVMDGESNTALSFPSDAYNGQYESIPHFLKHLYDEGWDGRLYSDDVSYNILFFVWLKLAFPNIDDDIAFILYNIIKQREALIFPDNTDAIGFIVPRITDKNNSSILSKAEFLQEKAEFDAADTATPEFYTEFRNLVKDDFSIEIQMASYLSGNYPIHTLTDKFRRVGSKMVYSHVYALRDWLRENIMSEKVKSMTGISLNWDDTNWESTLRSQSAQMDFLFKSDEDAIRKSWSFREQMIEEAWYWIDWVVNNTSDDDINNYELWNIRQACLNNSNWKNINSDDINARYAATAALMEEDINSHNVSGLAIEQLKEKVNSFWIEYIYQLKRAGDTTTLAKLSHT